MYLILGFILSFVGYCFNSNGTNVKLNRKKIDFLNVNGKYVNKCIKLTSSNHINKHKKDLSLPNTVLINNNLKNRRVLSIDFNNNKVSISFNFNNHFELLGSFSFMNYHQLTLKILDLINKYDYSLNGDDGDQLVVLMGVPFNYCNDNVYSNLYGFTNENCRLLFQILYILDYASYLSYHLNRSCIINGNQLSDDYPDRRNFYPHLRNFFSQLNTSSSSTTNTTNTSKDEECNSMLIDTYCLYCSLISNSSSNCNNTESHKGNEHKLIKDVNCTLNRRIRCRNVINLNKLNHLVIATSEQLSSYQTSSIPYTKNSKDTKDNLSTLNIYYNFINSKENVLILPNCNFIFNKNKSENLLLFNKIKQNIFK